MKIAKVKWRDSQIYFTQCNKDEEFDVCIIESVGYVITDNNRVIVLAGEIVGDEDVRRVIAIPKENCLEINILNSYNNAGSNPASSTK